MEVLTETKPGGTKLRFNADRSLDQPSGDSVISVHGERDGTTVIESTYVQVDEREARAVGLVMDQIQAPTPPLLDKIAQDVQSTFGSKLSGRDAHQVAEIATRCWSEYLSTEIGPREASDKISSLTERFQRAAASSRQPTGSGNGSETSPGGGSRR